MRRTSWLQARLAAAIDAVIGCYAPLAGAFVVALALSEPALTSSGVAAGMGLGTAAVLGRKTQRRRPQPQDRFGEMGLLASGTIPGRGDRPLQASDAASGARPGRDI